MTGFVVLFGVLFVGTLAVGVVRERVRVRGLRELAGARGWEFTERPNAYGHMGYHGEPFRESGGGGVRNRVTGRHEGCSFVAFQYSYSRGTGSDSRKTYRFANVAVRLPGGAPHVEIKRRGLGDGLSRALGINAFRLGEAGFDERFAVKTEHEEFARGLLQAGLAGWLMSVPDGPPLTVDGWLRTWTRGRLRADELPGLVDFVCTVKRQVPDGVWPRA